MGWHVPYAAVRAHKQPNNSPLFPLTLAFFLTDANAQRRLQHTHVLIPISTPIEQTKRGKETKTQIHLNRN